MRIRARYGVGAGLIAFVAFLYSGALAGSASSPDANGCATVVSVDYIDGTGVTVTGPGPGIGQIRHYGAPDDGALAIIAPSDFVPASATDRELAVFGYPPRPSGGDERAQWEKNYGHSHSGDPGAMCPSGRRN